MLLEKIAEKYTILNIDRIVIDLERIKDKRYFVKKAYQILTDPNRPTDADSVQWRVNLVRYLESMFGTEFNNTRDFKRETANYLKNYEIRKGTAGDRIKKARKKAGLTQKELAARLGYKTHVTILNYEKGKRYPEEKVFQWLNEVGV
jgi:DNA-binding XRE family transcriptional regulator